MNICVDIGNTTIKTCMYNEEFSETLSFGTHQCNKEEIIFEKLSLFKDIHHLDADLVTHIIYSSVVTYIDDMFIKCLRTIFKNAKLIRLDYSLKLNVSLKTESPKEVGADLIADAVGGVHKYGYPLIVIDYGTVTKILVINNKKEFSSVLFFPGLEVSFKSLNLSTSLLPQVDARGIENAIQCNNTEKAIKGGVMYSQVEAVKGIINRLEEELSYQCQKVVCGGSSIYLEKILPSDYIKDQQLTLDGLKVILELNK